MVSPRIIQGAAASYAQGLQPTGQNQYAAGSRVYGAGRPMPNLGPSDKQGYAERDRLAKVKRDAMLKRIQALQGGNPGSPDANRTVRR